ncbi:MAG TPA: carboxyl transferase domain-containing protein [Vicinamibacterales bacterium]|nr:carboxyl transferase domain-containing protein [Vicinamibacterales bacterium]
MIHEFQRLAILSRGEPAMRAIHAVREFNLERRTAIRTIVLYTEPDRRARFVREADESFLLGPATFLDDVDGRRKCGYLDFARLEHALTAVHAEAVWPGWGFVAERSDFVQLCERLGVLFIGPDSRTLRRLADKIAAKRLAEETGLEVIPWGGEAATTLDLAWLHAQRLGYPVIVKAAAGAGGRGLRLASDERELRAAFDSARREAGRSFGDDTVFVERYLQGVRHVEVQVQGDRLGTLWAVGVRDCSIQRRFQKLAAEAPSPVLTAAEDEALRDAALRLCRAADYRDQATVEFLFHPGSRQFLFMEVNPRLQVEHPVTEHTTGMDLVKLQLHVSRGGLLEGNPPVTTGHAIEVRLNAENVDSGFAAAPGEIELFRLPTGPGLRVDSGVGEGDVIPAEFGPMFAKLSAVGHSRDEALGRLKRALAESAIAIKGGASNRTLLLDLVDRPEVRAATCDTAWLDRATTRREAETHASAGIALLQAAIEVYDQEAAVELEAFFSSAARMRPTVRAEVGRAIEVGYLGHRYEFKVYRQGTNEYCVEVGGTRIDLTVDRLGPCERWITHDENRYRVLSQVDGYTHLVEVDGIPHRISRADAGLVRAPGPAVVVAIPVRPGERVAAGDRLAVLESMKMELAVTTPFAGIVRQVLVLPNAQVGTGSPLVHVEAIGFEANGQPGARVTFEGIALAPDRAEKKVSRARAILRGVKAGLGELKRSPGVRVPVVLQNLRRLMLGFDVDPAETRRLVSEYLRACQAQDAADADQRRTEDDLLRTFVDISAVFGRQGGLEGEGRLSAEEYLYSYLRTLDAQDSSLPPDFVESLQRAVAHYGVEGSATTPALRESLLWMFKSRRRVDQQVHAVLAVLQQRLERGDGAEVPGFRGLLDHLVGVSRQRFPGVAQLARDVRYRSFDRPAYEDARRSTYASVDAHLAAFAGRRTPADRPARIAEMVACPQSLKERLTPRLEQATPAVRQVMLEVLSRRFYRSREFDRFAAIETGARSIVVAGYQWEGRPVHLVATHADDPDLRRPVQAVQRAVQMLPPGEDVVVDIHVWTKKAVEQPDAASDDIRQVLDEAGFDRPIRRVVVMLSGPGVAAPSGQTQSFTFRPGADGFREQKLYRGMHPMMAKRLELWRLRHFFVDRISSSDEDVYLFRGVARDNPKDERLFAMAEVRDATPLRGPDGEVLGLPQLERMTMEALTAIRQVQALRPQAERLQWNRVILYVKPALTVGREDLERVVRRLVEEAEGLGLQKMVIRGRIPDETGQPRDAVVRVALATGHGPSLQFREPTDEPIQPLTEYAQKVVRMRQRGLTYPYELIRLLTPEAEGLQSGVPAGTFVEHDLDAGGGLVPVDRPYGKNTANVVVGLVTNFTAKYPEGVQRVIVLGDPSKEVGSLAEPECARILAALDMAERMRVPLEWFALSAGAKIAMESGTENMDWIAKVLRRLIEFTQAGHEINIIVLGINVGGQPYWNAEATMLMHTRGILVMTPEGAMVLTGKTALEYSGSVSAEDNQGIGGYEHIMGPNGQAQYWARDIGEACRILFRHYDHAYVRPGERFPRRAATSDAISRDVREYPHGNVHGTGFATVGDVFSDEKNPGRKKPFDIRRVLRAVSDQDHEPLERWAHLRDGENAVTWDAHIGGYPVALLGFESRPVPRVAMVPPDGPQQFTSGTLFPVASRKVARFINAASGVRPLVILANLSGFDGSPESMRRRQLEFGAEIGRAVVNFQGPIVFVVISRYHGGAFVVFSRVLNENMEVVALEGTYASVIGGAPAAAVVFARDVDARTRKDPRVAGLQRELEAATDAVKAAGLRARLFETTRTVRSEKLGEVADEFDRIHSVHRALQVGSLDRIIQPADLRPYVIDAIERGMARELQRLAAAT